MIDQNVVKNLVEEWLVDKDYFLVDVMVNRDDKITVEIDHADGVYINDCVELSKFIEERLDRDKEDYELEVGSAGLGQPFKVSQQYLNHVGEQVEVLGSDGKKVRGTLKSVDGRDFVVTANEKVKVEGKKRPVAMDVDHQYNMDNVKYTKYLISFK
ncbi:MAG: ribosome assembly cofactor RimP [Prevotella sp.]|jgi:ribosome maturation factor RimP|nr:ribosome assembly cofactor RimP [Prevotella sp.]MDD4532902.1 ribosome assembly cofactor RimP [Prevotella sp.]